MCDFDFSVRSGCRNASSHNDYLTRPGGGQQCSGLRGPMIQAGTVTHSSREIDRILNRLERLRRMRREQPLPPQIDVTIS
jgi:hypothetical protein